MFHLLAGVAALTCEATHATTTPFEQGNFDGRPHRGQIACAERLRLMLEGSKSVNSKKARKLDRVSARLAPRRLLLLVVSWMLLLLLLLPLLLMLLYRRSQQLIPFFFF